MRLHHVNIACTDIEKSCLIFCRQYGFKVSGNWLPASSNKDIRYVLMLNGITICLSQARDIDTVDDIAYCVESVKETCDLVKCNGGEILEQPHFLDCIQRSCITLNEEGSCNCFPSKCKNYIEKAVIKSPIGNLKHTLLNKENFDGIFLPGFTQTCDEIKSGYGIDQIDHIAMAVEFGNSEKYMTWYKNCLQFSRFVTSKAENEFGLIIQAKDSESGLRLLTLKEHPCSELGIQSTEVVAHKSSVKFVFGESISKQESDQITLFLNKHKGEGVQHIAFHTTTIVQDSLRWKNDGVCFIKPPNQYYEEIASTLDKLREKDNILALTDIGILVDAECVYEHSTQEEGYLYQIFTHPVLDTQTFFFELVYRNNANGFGAGNVKALWRAMDRYLKNARDL